MSKLSAFKLFYDEFIYKDNSTVVYDKVDNYFLKIKNIVSDLRKMPRSDEELYNEKLNRYHKRLKNILDDILTLNYSVFEYFCLLYKAKLGGSNDSVNDMPFIVSLSFYEDYKLNNGEYNGDKFIVPLLNSSEKKKIRDDAKKTSKIQFFLSLLENDECSYKYKKFIDRFNYISDISPIFNESHRRYLDRIERELVKLRHLYSNLEIYVKNNDSYEYITEVMYTAYRMKMKDWNKCIDEMIIEYFDNKYNEELESNNFLNKFSFFNNISYDSYVDIVQGLLVEKEKLDDLSSKGKFNGYKDIDNNFYSKFKENLINLFFDNKYRMFLDENASLEDCVSKACSLYSLSDNLINQLFDKCIFDSAFSLRLKKNNDVNGAILKKIYEIYNPYYLITLYDNLVYDLSKVLASKDKEFMDEYNSKVNEMKLEYDFHGPIPNKEIIHMKLNDVKKKFIEENLIDQLLNKSIMKEYDTRDYDLLVLMDDFTIDDVIRLYQELSVVIDKCKSKNLLVGNNSIDDVNYYRKLLKCEFQKICSLAIINRLNSNNYYDYSSINVICRKYLKEDYLAGNGIEKYISLDDFRSSKDKTSDYSRLNLVDQREVLIDNILNILNDLEKICKDCNIDFKRLDGSLYMKNKKALFDKDFNSLLYLYTNLIKIDVNLIK